MGTTSEYRPDTWKMLFMGSCSQVSASCSVSASCLSGLKVKVTSPAGGLVRDAICWCCLQASTMAIKTAIAARTDTTISGMSSSRGEDELSWDDLKGNPGELGDPVVLMLVWSKLTLPVSVETREVGSLVWFVLVVLVGVSGWEVGRLFTAILVMSVEVGWVVGVTRCETGRSVLGGRVVTVSVWVSGMTLMIMVVVSVKFVESTFEDGESVVVGWMVVSG